MLRRFQIAYLLVNAAHIISVGLVLGAIMTLDLRGPSHTFTMPLSSSRLG